MINPFSRNITCWRNDRLKIAIQKWSNKKASRETQLEINISQIRLEIEKDRLPNSDAERNQKRTQKSIGEVFWTSKK